MKRVKIDNLKKECLKVKGAKRAHCLKSLFEEGFRGVKFYKQFENDNNAAVKAVLRRIFREISGNSKSEEISEVDKIKKSIESTNKKEKKIEIIKEALNQNEDTRKEILLFCLNDPSWEIRDWVSNIIAEDKGFTNEEIYELVENPLWIIRKEGIKILGIRKDEKVFEYRDNFLKETNTDIKITYIEAVEKVGGKKALSVVYKFKKDDNQWVKKRAEKAINELLKKEQNIK